MYNSEESFTEHVLSPTEETSYWIRWSPYELSVGRGLTVDSEVIASGTHQEPNVTNYHLLVSTKDNEWANITINYGVLICSYLNSFIHFDVCH